jgi:hypothetical protein
MKNYSFILYFLGILISPLSLAMEEDEAEEKQPGPPFTLSVEENSLSFKGNGAYLGEVLEELGRQTQIKVQVAEAVAEEKVLVSFEEFPVAQGIQLILKGRNYVLTYSEPVTRDAKLAARRVSEIRVLPNGSETANASPERQAAPEKQQTSNEDAPANKTPPQTQEEKKRDDIEMDSN